MKLGLVYNPNDRKLLSQAYSQSYRDMFLALQKKFTDVLHIIRNCNADDLDCDVILFYDIHSTHDIKIDNLDNHKSIKLEYFNDPHQTEQDFEREGVQVHKLGAEQRTKRAIERNVDFIICPSKSAYFKYIAPHIGSDAEKYLLWFPVAPENRLDKLLLLAERNPLVLANGSVWDGEDNFRPYEFRNWAFKQSCVYKPTKVAMGKLYQEWLTLFSGALALCDIYVCPKYIEVPLSGCVCFAQELDEYKELGFKDGENCIFVNRNNFKSKINDFKNHISDYQNIANEGRKMALNYTADKFADFIYDKIKEKKN